MAEGVACGLLLMAAAAVLSVTAEIWMSGCDGETTMLEGKDREFRCYGSLAPASTYHWTLVTDAGSTLPLATCYGPNNCTRSSIIRPTFPGIFSQQYNPTEVYLRYIRTPRQFSGQLSCRQVFANHTEQSVSCGLRIGRISSSGDWVKKEDSSASFTCDTSTVTPSSLTWSLTTDAGMTLILGECDDVNSCTSPHSSITVSRPTNQTARVFFNSLHRRVSGRLSCSLTYQGVVDADSQQLNIFNPPKLSNCGVGIMYHNWSFLLACDVTRVFSSTGVYQFTITERFQFTKGSQVFATSGTVFTGRKSYADRLTAYTSGSKECYRGRLVHHWPLSPLPAVYFSFTTRFFPGGSSVTVDQLFAISPPAAPRHNCSDVSCARDTDLSPCVCSTQHLGTPAGRLLWLLGDTVLASGDYGANHLELPHNAVSTTKGWVMVTCQLDWVTSFSVSVVFDAQCQSTSLHGQPASMDNPGEWIGVGVVVGALMATLIITAIAIIVMWRRGLLPTLPCGCHLYDSPRPHRRDPSRNPDFHVYEVVSEVTESSVLEVPHDEVYENAERRTHSQST